MNTTGTDEDFVKDEDRLPAGWKMSEQMKSGTEDNATTAGGGGEYNLVGLIGWWRRIEKEEEYFWKECIRKEEYKLRRRSTKMSFIKRFYPAANLEEDGKINLTGILLQVDENNQERTVALNPEKTLKQKRKIDNSVQQMGSPSKIRKTNTTFSSTQQFWGGKQGSSANKHGTRQNIQTMGLGGKFLVNLKTNTKGSGGM